MTNPHLDLDLWLVVYDSTEVFVCFCVCIWRVYSLRRICGASTWLDGRVWQNALDSLGTVFVISNKVLSTNHQRIANNRPIISPEIGDNPSLQSFGLFWHLWTRWNGSHSCHPGCKFMSAKSFNADAVLYDVILFHRTTEFQKQKKSWTIFLNRRFDLEKEKNSECDFSTTKFQTLLKRYWHF